MKLLILLFSAVMPLWLVNAADPKPNSLSPAESAIMPATVQFGQHTITCSAITIDAAIEPVGFETELAAGKLTARSTSCVIAGTKQSYEGSIELHLEESADGVVSWQADAEMAHPIKGIKVEVSAVPGHTVYVSPGKIIRVLENKPLLFAYPHATYIAGQPWTGTKVKNMHAQAFVITGDKAETPLLVRSKEYPPRFKGYWLSREGDGVRLGTYLEANAFDRQLKCSTPVWYLEPVPDVQTGYNRHFEWMEEAYGTRPLEERDDAPDWVKDICMCIKITCHAKNGEVHYTFAQIEERLRQVAQYYDPHRVRVHLVGWDGPWDWTYPNYRPDPMLGGEDGFRKMMATAHELGYRVGVHMNVWGLGLKNPQFDELQHFLEHQVRDSEDRRLWHKKDTDRDGHDEPHFAYISPDYKPWRTYMIGRILKAVRDFGIDIVHLDQATTMVNDRRHNHWRGVCALFRELRAQLPPDVALSGEGTGEVVAHLFPMCGHIVSDVPHLYASYVRIYGAPSGNTTVPRGKEAPDDHLKRLRQHLDKCVEGGQYPTLPLGDYSVGVESAGAHAVYEAAKRFQAILEAEKAVERTRGQAIDRCRKGL